MRILLSNSFFHPVVVGGAEVVAKSLAENLISRGHDVLVLTLQRQRTTTRDQVDGIDVVRIGNRNIYWHADKTARNSTSKLLWHSLDRFNPFVFRSVCRVIRNWEPDLLFSHNLAGFSSSLWSAALSQNVPIVQVLHDYYSVCAKSTMYVDDHNCESACASCRWFRPYNATLSDRLNAVVGVSSAVLNRQIAAGVFRNTPIKCVINNARKLPETPRQSRRMGSLRFGFIGAITEAKGVLDLLRQFTLSMRKSDHQIELWIAGVGENHFVKALKDQYESDRIRFVGRVNPEDFYAQIDCCIVPSRWQEPFPTVVLEALGSGVPVIGSRMGGIPEVVSHGQNGLLFDHTNPEGLSDCIFAYLSDSHMRSTLIANTRTSVTGILDIESWIAKYENLFDQVISLHTPSSPKQ